MVQTAFNYLKASAIWCLNAIMTVSTILFILWTISYVFSLSEVINAPYNMGEFLAGLVRNYMKWLREDPYFGFGVCVTTTLVISVIPWWIITAKKRWIRDKDAKNAIGTAIALADLAWITSMGVNLLGWTIGGIGALIFACALWYIFSKLHDSAI